jgi:hypothetical protein
MYALSTRVIRNVGDDLIHVRGRRIIEHVAPHAELVVVKGSEPLASSLSAAQIATLQAIVVPGGPGARRKLDEIYPFLQEAEQRNIPVHFMGVGARFFPGWPGMTRELIDPVSAARLRHVGRVVPIGVRDHITQHVLKDVGVPAQVNGCPAWYSIPHLNQRPALPRELSRVAISTPNELRFFPQCLGLLRTTRALLPSARVVVASHQGVRSPLAAVTAGHEEIVRVAKSLGFEIAEIAADASKLTIYEDCDAHIGYRVHAHIFFSSLRKPTYLLAEDSRGLGVLQSLGGLGLIAWNEIAELEAPRRVLLRARAQTLALPSAHVAEWLSLTLERELDLGFPHVELASRIIDESFRTRMAPFVRRAFGVQEAA